ncbi:MAG: CRISPR-associated endonuclease Cas1 [Peptostreptococcaceae bacterium]|nr:CRISPR-associated endonuclease Cas1 [Peptostreptococcaceae bacterium]
MITTTIQEIKNEENTKEALVFFQLRKDGSGMDGMRMSEMNEYIRMNKEWFWDYWERNNGRIGMVKTKEILSTKGRKRKVYLFNSIDRIISRMLCQSIQPQLEELLTDECHSYRENRGTTSAVTALKRYVEEGYEYLLEVDIHKFFENIEHDKMQKKIKSTFEDINLQKLLSSFVMCEIFDEGQIYTNSLGLITGANISPMLSNLYLNDLDAKLHNEGRRFVRYGDNYFFLFQEKEEAEELKIQIIEELKSEYFLDVNLEKTGIFLIFSKKILGHLFSKSKTGAIMVKKVRKPQTIYNSWNESVLEKKQNKYHLINDGILSKKDWTILFENEQNKRYLPVEIVDNLNVYSNIVFDSDIFRHFSEKRIITNIFDRYGNIVGRFIPDTCTRSAKLMMKQVELYLDETRRIEMAKKLEIAALHNLRSNLRYYRKKRKSTRIEESIVELSSCIEDIEKADSINDMMMIEARGRQSYYSCFNEIIREADFLFTNRSKRPPKDALNALISFGNVFLYNEIAGMINKTGLDIRISIVHSANNRSASLNLDLADIFKPVVIDRVIFAIINRNEIRSREHFEKVEGGGIYLNKEGKLIFLRALEEKLDQVLMVDDKRMTYEQIIQEEVYKLLRYMKTEEEYKPYKYGV